MPFARVSLRRSPSETAMVDATDSAESSTAKEWFSSEFKKMTAHVICVVVAALILWQSHGFHFYAPSTRGYTLISLRIFVIPTLVLASVKLVLRLRDFYSQLHNEDVTSKEPASGARMDGGGGDDLDDFFNFCRSEGFPLHRKKNSDPESDDDDEASGDMRGVESRF